MCEHEYHHPLPENWDGMGWDGESGVTMSLGLVWSSVAQGAGKTPPQGEPKGQTNWSPCWALLWAKSCWFEELPDPGAFTDGHQQRHLVSLPLSLLPRHHPSPSIRSGYRPSSIPTISMTNRQKQHGSLKLGLSY